MEKKHELDNTLVNLKDFKKELENYVIILDSGRGVSLSNLPTHFWCKNWKLILIYIAYFIMLSILHGMLYGLFVTLFMMGFFYGLSRS